MKISPSDVRKGYTSEKARTDMTTQPWVYFVLRPLSFYITPSFINLKISANVATYLGLIPLVLGIIFILRGPAAYINVVIGAILLNIWYLLDVVDGNIARFHNKATKFGALLDTFMGRLGIALLFICLGIELYWAGPTRPTLNFGIIPPGWVWLLMAVGAALTELLRDVVSLKGQLLLEKKSSNKAKSKMSFWSILPKAIISSQLPAFLLAALINALGIYLAFYAFYKALVLAGMLGSVLHKASLADHSDLGA